MERNPRAEASPERTRTKQTEVPPKAEHAS
jgi:hypothetical protein